ncbi:PAC2 family protein [Ornithinicoccus hortensis]|uniref:PAC2 family protein n=1 Tax=Ornithinicoccus hortensis TaxID=82346 RepID=A0A542YR02_9MICO|nr:PAC2 family protein [Ornithinicoccus hortensis]TQL50520.1 PAC2 family protein [Ornithinicoccus hortensis]
MTERSPLFQLTDEAARQPMHAPHLIVSLEGFMDAGLVSEQVADHLLEALEHEVVATFDVDQLVDYRGRRPVMTFDSDHWDDYEAPSLLLYRMQDHAGQDFLLLHGSEPDYRWEGFVKAVRQLCLAFGVRRMTTAHGVPMAVPHTRPVGMTRFGSDPEVVGLQEAVFGRVQVPASAESLLHLRLGEAGLETFGIAVHVPHYLAQARFGDAAVAALDTLLVHSGLQVPTADLVEAASLNRVDITKEVAGSTEVTEVVEALEQRYDRFLEGQRRRSLLASEAADLPSAEEIGAEFEEFLRETTSPDAEGDPDGPAD